MDTRPNWEPAKTTVPDLLPVLMCMGTDTYDGVQITLYKHVDTRRYINLGADGTAYDIRTETTATEISLDDAKSHLLS